MRATIKYSMVRVLIFAVALAVLLVLQVNVFIAAVIAAAAGFALSYIFFRKLRDQVAIELATRGARNARNEVIPKDADTDAEDAALDNEDR